MAAAPALDPRLDILFRTVHDALLLVDDDRRCVNVNPHAVTLFRSPQEELLSRRIEDYTPPEHLPLLDELWATLERDGELHGPYEMLCGDGARIVVDYRATRDFATGLHLIAARRSTREPLTTPHGGPRLTRRELEVLQLVADGGSAATVATRLVLSTGTVKTHLQHIYEKLNVRDRAAAVAEGIRHGLIS